MGKKWLKSWPQGIPQALEFPQQPLPEFLREHARRNPEKTAINFYGREISFRELDVSTEKLSAALIRFGLRKGDRVSLFLENCPQFALAFLAVLRAGGVVVAANPMFKEEELKYEITDAGARMIIAQDMLYPQVEKIRKEAGLSLVVLTSYHDYLPATPSLPLHSSMKSPKERFPDTCELLEILDTTATGQVRVPADIREDLALLQYTSGTTGLPKGAMITHSNLLHNTVGSAVWYEVGAGDIHLSVLPFFHVTGMIHSLCMPLYTGTTNIMLSRFDADSMLQAVAKYRCTMLASIMTMNVAILNDPGVEKYDLRCLRVSLTGGAPVPKEILEKWRRLIGTELVEGYGLSETISQTHMNPYRAPRYGSIGLPQFGNECRIVDAESGADLPLESEGELVIKGPTIMKGYWNKPEGTAEVLQDGWLYTGDIARMDEDGFFYIVGRKKDLIKASGFSVFPAEVESFLYGHPAVQEVSVIGVPDPYRGENIKACIILKPEYRNRVTEEEIVAWCRGRMAAYKYPRLVQFMEEFPKTASGKVLKRVLRGDTEKK